MQPETRRADPFGMCVYPGHKPSAPQWAVDLVDQDAEWLDRIGLPLTPWQREVLIRAYAAKAKAPTAARGPAKPATPATPRRRWWQRLAQRMRR